MGVHRFVLLTAVLLTVVACAGESSPATTTSSLEATATTTTPVAPTSQPETTGPKLTMEFEETALEADLEECSLDPLRTDQVLQPGGLRLTATDDMGAEWTVSVILNQREPGDFSFSATGPGGTPTWGATPENSGNLDSEIGETTAVFNTLLFDKEAVEDSIPVTLTIDCGQTP